MRLAAFVLGLVLVVHVAPEARAEEDPWAQAVALEQRGDLEGALALLEAHPSTDGARKTHVAKLRGAVQALEAAKLHASAGRPDVARGLIDGVIEKLDPLDDVVLASALHAEAAEIASPSESGIWSRTTTTLRNAGFTMLEWLLYFVAVGALLAVLRWLHRLMLRPKAGTAIVIEDLAERGGGSSTMLEKQLAAAVHRLRQLVARGPSHLEAGLPESTAFMRPTAPELELEDLVDGKAVSVGPVSVSPKYLLSVIRMLWQRPYQQTIKGWLVEEGGEQRLVVERVCHGKLPGASDRWVSVSKSRAEVLEDTARHLLFELGKPSFTASRESFVLYCRAMQAKEPDDARRLLQASLRRDPSNWMARLELAEVLSKRHNPTAAIAHLDHLEWRLERDAKRLGDVAEELRCSVQFNRAVALAMLGSPASCEQALALFTKLLKAKPDALVVRSARDAVWLAQVVNRDAERLATVEADIADELKWIKQRTPATAEEWGEYAQARAMIASVQARVLLAKSPSTPAAFEPIKTALYDAMAMMPDFLDPYVTLVRLQMQGKSKHYPNWMKEAEETLKAALELDPSSEQVRYALGKLYALPTVARYDDAKVELGRAPSIAKSHWKLADIAHDHDRDVPKALEHMRRSLSLDPAADQRLASFVQWTLEPRTQQASPDLLAEAKDKAQRLAEQGVDDRLRTKGATLLAELVQRSNPA